MVTDFYPPLLGGVEVVVRNLALGLAGRGHEVSVATIQADGLAGQENDGPVRVHRVRCSTQRFGGLFSQRRPWAPPTPDPEARKALRRLIMREKPDVVHGHDWLARSCLTALGRRRRPAFLMSLHYYTITCPKKTLVYRDGSLCSGPGFSKCLRCAAEHYGPLKGAGVVAGNGVFAAAERRAVDLFLPVSAATARGNRLPDSDGARYEVMPNFLLEPPPLDPTERRLLEQLPSEAFLLFVGDVRREKGIDVLFDAYRRLEAPPPLVVIGKLWPDSITEMPPGVVLMTDWPNGAVRAAQQRCLALVAPSVWPEPFPTVVLEALAAGKPVVGARSGGIPEQISHGRTGLLVAAGDREELRLALDSLVSRPDLALALGEEAARAATAYTPERVLPRVERAYERAIELARAR
jgi:glycosyltransferase involved in cell wall biosynthesis